LNVERWTEILADPFLAKLPYRIETDQHGHILMSPPPAPLYGRRQMNIGLLLHHLLPHGQIVSECPLSTAGGVKAVDVAWVAPQRSENIDELTVFERAPDICVEILSLLPIPRPRSTKNARSISMQAPPRFGYATSTDRLRFSSVPIIEKTIPLFARRFLTGSHRTSFRLRAHCRIFPISSEARGPPALPYFPELGRS
jgi:hypothetical protein